MSDKIKLALYALDGVTHYRNFQVDAEDIHETAIVKWNERYFVFRKCDNGTLIYHEVMQPCILVD